MRRRNFVAGVGAVLGSASLALGSGAFSSAQTSRDMEISVVQDDDAYLYLDPEPVSGHESEGPLYRSLDDGDTVGFYIPGQSEDNVGVGPNSNYIFQNLLEIRNYGTTPVEIYSSYEDDLLKDIRLFHDGNILTEYNRSSVIEPGGTLENVGLAMSTKDIDEYNLVGGTDTVETEVTIRANDPDAPDIDEQYTTDQ